MKRTVLVIALVSAFGIVSILVWQGLWLFAAGVTVLALSLAAWGLSPRRIHEEPTVPRTPNDAPATLEATAEQKAQLEKLKASGDPETAQLVVDMLEQDRYALLLRAQITANLTADQRLAAHDALDRSMSIVPDGDVIVRNHQFGDQDDNAERERSVAVDAVFLDRYLVTNRQFQRFVDAGGYEQMSLWEPAIWAGVLDFVDLTGYCGPRFWREGRYASGEDDHPVVGVSWFEACAYGRWVGKRLPTDAEWVKAGVWPIAAAGNRPSQRKYPWGDTMDRGLINIWGTGEEKTCAVTDYPDGVSVGGIYQLVGNVWEWTWSNFPSGDRLEFDMAMKSIRGAAFDTYFDTQATCQFQSAEGALSRKHNIGFRCALGVCDVVSIYTELDVPDETELEDDDELIACGSDGETV